MLKEKFAKIWFCPEDKDPYPKGYMNNPHNGMTSYALNGYYGTVDGMEVRLGPAGGYKFHQISNPSACMLMGETSYASQFYDIENPKTAGYNLPSDGHHRMTSGFYHNRSMNILFVDGHVADVKGAPCKPNDKYYPSNYKNKNYAFWRELTLPTSVENPSFWSPGY